MRTSIACLALVASIVGTACTSPQDTVQTQATASPKVAAMTMRTHLVRNEGVDGPAECVLAALVIAGPSGDVVATPRIFTSVGKPALWRIGTERDWIEVSVQARRSGDTVTVGAELTSSDGATNLIATDEAKDGTMPVTRAR